jgi:hypothetical protein
MINNVLRSIRYMLDLSEPKVIEIARLADSSFVIERDDVRGFLRKECRKRGRRRLNGPNCLRPFQIAPRRELYPRPLFQSWVLPSLSASSLLINCFSSMALLIAPANSYQPALEATRCVM